MLIVPPPPAKTASSISALAYVTSAESTTQTITVPGTAQAGDIAFLFDMTFDQNNSPASVTPTGWSSIVQGVFENDFASAVSYKVLTAGDISASVSGTLANGSGTKVMRKTMLVFRPTGIINTVNTVKTTQHTLGNPFAVAANPSGAPCVVLSCIWTEAGFSPLFTTASPAFAGQIAHASGGQRVGYKIYDSAPSNHTIDSGDNGYLNYLYAGVTRLS